MKRDEDRGLAGYLSLLKSLRLAGDGQQELHASTKNDLVIVFEQEKHTVCFRIYYGLLVQFALQPLPEKCRKVTVLIVY